MIVRKSSSNHLLQANQRPNLKTLKRLVIRQEGYIRLINFEQIEYIKADRNYSFIHLVGGKKILVSKTLKSIVAGLDNTFIKTHKSYIINIRHMDTYVLKDSHISMSSGDLVPVSRSNKSKIKNILIHTS